MSLFTIQYLIFKEIQTTKNNNTNNFYETACASISSINLEESLTSLEDEIKTIFYKKKIFYGWFESRGNCII